VALAGGAGRSAALLVIASALVPGLGQAQELAGAERLLEAGDTGAALAIYERVSRKRWRDAALHFRIGVLYLRRVTPGDPVSADRRAALEHLGLATRLAPDSAAYWLTLALLYRGETDVTARLQVAGTLERARAAARRHGSPLLAEIEYRLGRMAWERYEHAADRHELVDGTSDIDPDRFLNDWTYVEDLFARRLRPAFRGIVEWRQALEHLEAALASDPLHLDAAGLYVVALGAFERWDSAVAVTERLVKAGPDSGRAWALRGLALARAGGGIGAAAAFDAALERLPAPELAPYRALERVLTPDDGRRLATLDDSGRAVFAARHWGRADPLWLTPDNEVRTEFLARITYADHRWADDLRGYHGYESDRGAVYLRYGPPDRAATLGPLGAEGSTLTIIRDPGRDDPDRFRPDPAERLDRSRTRLLWVYQGSRRRYLFGLTPGYARAVFAGNAADRFRYDRETVPRGWDNVPIVRAVDSIAVTALRFEDGMGTGELAVFGALPPALAQAVGADSPAVALFVERADRVDRVSTADARPVSPGTWRWRLPEAPDTVRSLRVEALDARGGGAGRGDAVPRAPPDPSPDLRLSDLLVAPGRPDSAPHTRWFAMDLAPLAGPLPADQPLTLAWELYGLGARPEARYAVEIRFTVERVERRGLLVRIIGGAADALGLSAIGDERLVLRYERSRESAPALLEYVALDLSEIPRGTYRVTVAVTQAGSSVAAVAEHLLEVGPRAATP
jgi:GWxTD domain-containing protein